MAFIARRRGQAGRPLNGGGRATIVVYAFNPTVERPMVGGDGTCME